MRMFNTTGLCIPEKHYMVDISNRLAEIRAMVDDGKYFCINRARQYGKTTTLNELRKSLADDYEVISLDFQGISSEGFKKEGSFVRSFCRLLSRKMMAGVVYPEKIGQRIKQITEDRTDPYSIADLSNLMIALCAASGKNVVLIIDEVDSASNNQVFIDFLAQLREDYLSRNAEGIPAFQSVILAGVTDIKHLKGKIRQEDQHKVNSPWNIAADFNVDMSFSPADIEGMLQAYENDHYTGMDAKAVAAEIHNWTSGYPFLVSRICQLIDENRDKPAFAGANAGWNLAGIDMAVKMILIEDNTLFESLMGKLVNYPDLKELLRRLLLLGESVEYLPDDEAQKQLRMYGFITPRNNTIQISNRIFETRLYNQFLGESRADRGIRQAGDLEKNMFVTDDGRLDVCLILERFIATYHEIFGPLKDRFREKDGRELFLLYLKPIINGTGNYYIEPQTRDQRCMDVVVDYMGQRYVIELKIWREPRYNAAGEKQISDYLDYFGLNVGYMLSFNFNKEKQVGVERVPVGDKVLFEATL